MKWIKKGLIFCPDGSLHWAKTHAMVPVPELLTPDILRIYLTFCDDKGIGRLGYIDVSANDVSQVISISNEPLLDIGAPGTFDENGALTCSVVTLPDKTKMAYYAGFELGHRIRYRLLTGVALSSGGKFQRLRQVPILERSDKELYFRGGPFVVYEGDYFKMWYVAGSGWIDIDGKPMPVYTINYIESKDGINWPPEGKICIDIGSEEEHGFGRPYVIHENGIYKMFYSIRIKHKGYRIGYAESSDGVLWSRKDDEAGIDVSGSGWDSETVCYAAVITVKGTAYMFYNGNDFGRTGVGYAVLG
ncbi:MAG: hypothetical protein HQL01_02730 [Nitrospirae bacterium]|nr:hypothetical protein [Nitrospirota bacterium]